MTEQSTLSPPDDGVDHEGWLRVASQGGLHPALEPHLHRLLDQYGIPRPESPASEDSSTSAPEVTGAQQEAGRNPEVAKASTAEIAEAFAGAQNSLYKLSADPKFHDACKEKGLDPYDDMDKPAYWEAVANFTTERVGKLREQHGDTLKLRALELAAATPNFLFHQGALNSNAARDPSERYHSRQTVSSFHNLVRNFATDYPETSVSGMTKGLLNITNVAIEDRGVRQSAAQSLQRAVRGAQHEVAFGQILEKTGRPARPAELDEDLAGIDYVVDNGTSKMLYVDVKASLSEVEARGSSSAFAIKPDGRVVMYSLVKDRELGDRFFLSEESADLKALALNQLLTNAQQELLQRPA